MRLLSFPLTIITSSVPVPASSPSTEDGNIIYRDDNNPTIDVNPPQKGVLWVNTTTGEIFVCLDNTPNKNVWKGCYGTLIYPSEEPILELTNISSPTEANISTPTTEATFVFYGQGWQGGNYHFFFSTKTEEGWLNDAYYGNGFTVRKNCGFSYKYLEAPPADSELVAIFSWSSSMVLIRFYNAQTLDLLYAANVSIGFCSTPPTKICLYDQDCSGSNPLGGTIYRFRLYPKAFSDEADLKTLAQKIVEA